MATTREYEWTDLECPDCGERLRKVTLGFSTLQKSHVRKKPRYECDQGHRYTPDELQDRGIDF